MIQLDMVTIRCSSFDGNFEKESALLLEFLCQKNRSLEGLAYYSKRKTRLRMRFKQKLTQKKAEARDSW